MAELGLTRSGGAFVGAVVNDGAAARAGIRAGDVIVAFNGKQIVNSSELPPLVGAMPPGSRVTVKLIRDGKVDRWEHYRGDRMIKVDLDTDDEIDPTAARMSASGAGLPPSRMNAPAMEMTAMTMPNPKMRRCRNVG